MAVGRQTPVLERKAAVYFGVFVSRERLFTIRNQCGAIISPKATCGDASWLHFVEYTNISQHPPRSISIEQLSQE
ncbi:MAG: hypothetical protein ACO4CS_19400 [bacterium]